MDLVEKEKWLNNDDLKQVEYMQSSTFTKNEKHVSKLALEQ